MNAEANTVVKKFLSKMAKETIDAKKYSRIDKVDIFFVFGSNVKTAMCDWVYGMKIYTKLPLTRRDELVLELQMDLKNYFQKYFKQSICATDVIFEKDY